MKRLFIATPVITLSPEIQKITADLQYRLRHDEIVWVKDKVQHLTLRFLGATPPQLEQGARKALFDVCSKHSSFTLTINKIGAFGSRYNPRVLWLGFDYFEPFKKLFEDLEPKLQSLGFEPNESNFVPHITLGRIKNLHSKDKFWESVEEAQRQPIAQEIQITSLNLYQSFLHKEGPEYKVIGTGKMKSDGTMM